MSRVLRSDRPLFTLQVHAVASAMLPLLIAIASAHPLSMQVANHSTHVQVLPTEVRLRYEVSVPVHDAEQEALLQDIDQLMAGLVVTVDGTSLPLTLLDDQRITEGHDHRAELLLTAPLPFGSHALEISTGNYPFSPGVFSWSPELHRAYAVSSSSLHPSADGDPSWRDGRELPGDDNRSLSLEVEPRFGAATPLWLRLTPRVPWRQPLSVAARTHPLDRLRHHEPTPLAAMLGLVIGIAAGTLSPGRQQQRDPATALCFLSWLVVAGTCHPQLNSSLDLIAIAMLALVTWGTRESAPEWGVRLASASIVATAALATGSGVLGGLAWLAWAVTRGLRPQSAPAWGLRALATATATLLLTRAFLS